MRTPVTVVGTALLAVLASACPQTGSEARPDQTPPSAKETLPPDAGELEDPGEVVSPGDDAGTEEDRDSATGG